MSSYFKLRHSRSMKTLSRARPRPSMLILTPRCFRGARKSAPVNGERRSEVQISGWPKGNGASCAARQKPVSMVFGEFPTQHEAAEPIHDSDQVKEPATHRNICNIGAPDLVGPLDRQAAQQVWVDLVTRGQAAQVRFRIKSFDSHNPHEPLGRVCGSPPA